MNLEDSIRSLIQTRPGTVCTVFKDLVSGGHFAINGNLCVPSASLIKLPVLAELARQDQEGRLSLEESIAVQQKDLAGGDGILKELAPGHRFTLRELATLMIIVSDNTAAENDGPESARRRTGQYHLCRRHGLSAGIHL